MTQQALTFDEDGHWICPHGFGTGFFPVPGQPNLIEHRSCGICCEEISDRLGGAAGENAAGSEEGK